MATSVRTTDHDLIKRWVEERGGTPSVVATTWDGSSGVLSVDFGEEAVVGLEEISWDEFFRIFEESDLEFMFEEGEEGHFYAFDARGAESQI